MLLVDRPRCNAKAHNLCAVSPVTKQHRILLFIIIGSCWPLWQLSVVNKDSYECSESGLFISNNANEGEAHCTGHLCHPVHRTLKKEEVPVMLGVGWMIKVAGMLLLQLNQPSLRIFCPAQAQWEKIHRHWEVGSLLCFSCARAQVGWPKFLTC